MALESQGPKQPESNLGASSGNSFGDSAGEGLPVFDEKATGRMMLRAVVRPVARPVEGMRPEEEDALNASRFSGGFQGVSGGFQGVGAAGSAMSGRRRTDRLAADQDQVVLADGLGAMRGLAMVVGLYMAMGVMGLGGLMLWHWLH